MFKIDHNQLNYLISIHKENTTILKKTSLYLNNDSKYINKKMIDLLKKNVGLNITNDQCFKILLEDLFLEEKDFDSSIHEFVNENVKKLNPKDYYGNPYYNKIKVNNIIDNNWDLKYQEYEQYEAFIYKNQDINELYKVRPSVGYFDKKFSYLTVFQNGREWMAVKPNEIETMKEPIEYAKGNVLTFGLGLGYFAYMTSLKETVESITIVEKDQNVINLFKKYILPQFEYKNKIKIIDQDAYTFYDNLDDKTYDYIFIDIWHDVSDGLIHYLKFKESENRFTQTKINYWIESEIIIFLRGIMFDIIEDIMNNIEPNGVKIDDLNYKIIYNKLYYLIKEKDFNSFEELIDFLNDRNIKEIARKLYIDNVD